MTQKKPHPSLFDAFSSATLPAFAAFPAPKPVTFAERVRPEIASGEKSKARDILATIKTLQLVEREARPATQEERDTLARFCGFGPVALSIFPDPATGQFKPGWEDIGRELQTLLTPDEYASAKRTVFNAFYTSPVVITAMHRALTHLGVSENALTLEPGCGPGRFFLPGKRYLGVEMDGISGRIAKVLHPEADIRIEDFQKTRLPPLDAVIGNVPFADIPFPHNGHRFSLHDGFMAKSTDALVPGGVLALVTSHYTLDKTNAAIRDYLHAQADFVGAIRLPSDAFKKEGTAVVTDIVFLRKRSLDEPPIRTDWLKAEPTEIDGRSLPINRYFLDHPEMVLGTYSGKDSLYGEGYSVLSNGDLAGQLKQAVERLPRFATHVSSRAESPPPPAFVPPPPEKHITEGSFFVSDGRIHQMNDGRAEPVVYGGGELWANGALVGRRLGHLIELRDKARYVLRSQNEGWPESARHDARRKLNYAYDAFKSAYGPINKTTFSETKDGTTTRRMPNLAKFREDPDAMLVMALEEYDETTGEARKAAILSKDVVGKSPPITSVTSAEEGLLVSLDQRGAVDLPFIARLYGKSEETVIAELGELVYYDPEAKAWETADAYLSGNVRAKLVAAEKAGMARNVDALNAVQPEDVLPGDIDANLGAPWIPVADVQAFAAELFQVPPSSVTIAHMPKDAVWSVEGDYAAAQSVAATSDYGTARASGITLLELALNMKSPVIYDPVPGDPDKRIVNQEATMAAKEKQRQIKEQFKAWVFTDPDRTERLVRLYNDSFNCLRPRQFDGSHLQFPGMSQAVDLRLHQKDVIWRCMSGGNTLISHTVGAGKTYSAAAAAMKMKQAGLVKKCLLAVPNHLLEQFGREFQHLYPNAKLLLAGKDDFTKERRKSLTAKIASGDWDAIIVTHSSFERIGMSKEYQERFLREQIAEYDSLLVDRAAANSSKAKRNILKQLEKQKAAREAKLKELLAEEKKDSGLVFDELGVDQIIVDECFTYDTMIATNLGALKIGDIVTKRLRVSVKSVNPLTQAVEWKPVVNWFANKRRNQLVEVVHEEGSVRCTAHHKLFTGFVTHRKAGEIEAGETLLVLREALPPHEQVFGEDVAEVLLGGLPGQGQDPHGDVRVVHDRVLLPHPRSGQSGQEAPAVLLRQLQDAGATGEPGERSQVPRIHAAPLGQPVEQGPAESGGRLPDEVSQPDVLRRDAGAGVANAQGDWAQAACSGRERAPYGPADRARGQDGDGDRIRGGDQRNPAPDPEVREVLQGGLGRSESAADRRGGREHAQLPVRPSQGREEGVGPVPTRVVGVTVLEPGGDGKHRLGCRAHSVVYDIEVADNHNYFANGVLVSNCHAYKNLETPTKMDRVAGIQTGGSERAFDLYMKSKYLHDRHPGHGLVGMSGTPISNSLVELYTMQRFFDPEGLKSRGIDHFDAWAATFGEVVEAMEISPDGKSLRPRARFAKFVNLPELQQMFRAFADVQTAEMLNLPRPALIGGKPHIVACPMSPEQQELQDKLVERYERVRNGGVDPREDNALAITTDGRKLALDARMLCPTAPDYPGSKVNAMVENCAAIWERSTPTRGTQMIFCDMGVNPTAWGYSVYDQMVDGLASRGVPREKIAVMGDADSDAKKQALFEKVRNGTIRVLIGSTAKMGTGTNVQKRLIAMHHLDAPWKPAEVEQRDGRILRQGNTNAEVSIYRYVTEGSFDAYMWQALETKARFISQIMTGESGVRWAEDVGGQELSYAEVKAIASGNPAVLTLAEADAELQRLGVLRRNHADEQYLARRNLRDLPLSIERKEKRLTALEADHATITSTDGLTVGGKPGTEVVLGNALNRLPDRVDHVRRFPVGVYRGLSFGIERHVGGAADVYLEGQVYRTAMLSRESQGPRAVMNALNRLATSYGERITETKQDLALARTQLGDYEARMGKVFAHAGYADELAALRDRLKVALSGTPVEGEPTSGELAGQITALKASHHVEAAPQRVKPRIELVRKRVEVKVEEPKAPIVEEPREERRPVSFRQRVASRGGQMSLF